MINCPKCGSLKISLDSKKCPCYQDTFIGPSKKAPKPIAKVGKNTKRWIENDNMEDRNFRTLLDSWFNCYHTVSDSSAGVYVFHSTSTQIQFQQSLEANNFEIKNQLIWNKPSAALGWGDYRWKHEPFFYCGIKWGKTKFYGDRTHTTVIETLEGKSDQQILNIIKRVREAEKEGKTTIWSQKREWEETKEVQDDGVRSFFYSSYYQKVSWSYQRPERNQMSQQESKV